MNPIITVLNANVYDLNDKRLQNGEYLRNDERLLKRNVCILNVD